MLARVFDRLRAWLRRIRPRRSAGRLGEDAAAKFLASRGLRVIARNVRARRGEIDIVALDGRALVFVEVKARTPRPDAEITGLEKIHSRKRAALRRAVKRYRKTWAREAESCRLDAVVVELEAGPNGPRVREIRWHQAIAPVDNYSRG
jgi:putative endonuclease